MTRAMKLIPLSVDTMMSRPVQNAVWNGLVGSGGLVNGLRYVRPKRLYHKQPLGRVLGNNLGGGLKTNNNMQFMKTSFEQWPRRRVFAIVGPQYHRYHISHNGSLPERDSARTSLRKPSKTRTAGCTCQGERVYKHCTSETFPL